MKADGLIHRRLKAPKKCKGILGYTDTTTVKLDFDNVSFKTAKFWVFKILRLFRSRRRDIWTPQLKINLEGFLILKSSKKHYHVIFNKSVSWLENLNVLAWTCLLSHNVELMKWFVMQCVKGSSTLRIGKKEINLLQGLFFVSVSKTVKLETT